jgi:acetyl esterase/lipase
LQAVFYCITVHFLSKMKVFHLHTPGRFLIFTLFSTLLLFSACKKDTGDSFDPSVEKILQNEAYGAGSRQVADIYLPANRNAGTKVVILVHGGGWSDGDKGDLRDVITLLRTNWPEVAVVNTNYTLANNTQATHHPAQMNDFNTLVNYIKANKSLWQIGEDMGMAGVSAGAHLALLYSYAYRGDNRIKAVASVVGPTDFSDPFYINNTLFQVVAKNYLGKTWIEDPELHKAASPALRVSNNAPPTFIAYGLLDPIVPVSNATTLYNNLIAKSIPASLIEYPLEAHEFSPTSIQAVTLLIIGFMKTHL